MVSTSEKRGDDVSAEAQDVDPDRTGSQARLQESNEHRGRMLGRVKSATRHTKENVKKMLHFKHDDVAEPDSLDQNPAFHTEMLFQSEPFSMSKIGNATKAVAQAVANPRQTVKQGVAKKLAMQDQPLLSKDVDAALLRAQTELKQAEAERLGEADEEHTTNLMSLQGQIDTLEDNRAAMKVAWTTGRFVHRVRVVPVRMYSRPDRADPRYWERCADGRPKFRWELWLAHRLRYAHQGYNLHNIDDMEGTPAYDRGTLAMHLERCIKGSDFVQAWFMRLRRLSRWEDPVKSAQYFAAWTVVWLLNRVVSAILLWIVYIVIHQRYHAASASREELRESTARAVDRSASAYKVSEMINRHGRGDWLEPLVESSGPVVQTQLGDLADTLEVIFNFYEWKDPTMTTWLLVFFVTAIVYGNVVSTDFVMRINTLLGILYFFLARPIASHNPKYRHMVTPIKWLLGTIPTHAEYSFRYLYEHAQKIRKQLEIQENNQLRQPDDIEVHRFSAFWGSHRGHLVLTLSTIKFERATPRKILWDRPYAKLVDMCKVERGIARALTTMNRQRSLRLTFWDSEVLQLDGVKDRDEAFNTIIGFSGSRWKVEVWPVQGQEEEQQPEDLAKAGREIWDGGPKDVMTEDEFYDAYE